MTRPHQRLLMVLAAIAMLMLLFPPFEIRLAAATLNMGYGFLLMPPKQGTVAASINLSLLLTQWVALAIIGVAAWFTICRKDVSGAAATNVATSSHTPSPGTADSDATNATRDISAWKLWLGMLILCVVTVVLIGPPVLGLDPNEVVAVLAQDVGIAASFVVGGLLLAALSAGLARSTGRPRTTFRRNSLIAAWILGALGFLGFRANIDPARPTEAPRSQSHALLAPDARPLAMPEKPRAYLGSKNPIPWIEVAGRAEYREGTNEQRSAIRDVYWEVCMAPLIKPEQQTSARQLFLSDVEAGDRNLPPPAADPETGSTSVPDYLRQEARRANHAAFLSTVTGWCRT